ncbi:hypothetical protein VIMY103929_08285 [Vibrio mytili]
MRSGLQTGMKKPPVGGLVHKCYSVHKYYSVKNQSSFVNADSLK